MLVLFTNEEQKRFACDVFDTFATHIPIFNKWDLN